MRLRVNWDWGGEALGQVWHLRKKVSARTGQDVTEFFYALMSSRSAPGKTAGTCHCFGELFTEDENQDQVT